MNNCIYGSASANAPLPDPYPAGLTPNIMTTIPKDPLNVATDTCGSNGFFYGYRSTNAAGTGYTLYAKLENTGDPDSCAAQAVTFNNPNVNCTHVPASPKTYRICVNN